MNHINKKFLNQRLLTPKEIESLDGKTVSFDENANHIKVKNKDQVPYLITENNYLIRSFIYRQGKTQFFLPEPDQVLIYFNSAYMNYRGIAEQRDKLLYKTNPENTVSEGTQNDVYELFGLTSGFVIFLFSSIEAFMNRMIPDNYEFEEKKNNRTEIYNKEQIQKHLSFGKKYKEVIPAITDLDFQKNYPQKHQVINNLKNFRDELIHPKQEEGINSYEQLSKRALKFKYEKTLEVVRDYMNYYKKDYVIECDCGKDF